MRIFSILKKEKEIKYRYSIRDGNLFVEDTQTGKTVWEGKPDDKIVDGVLPLYGTDDCIVHLNIHKGYENITKKKEPLPMQSTWKNCMESPASRH